MKKCLWILCILVLMLPCAACAKIELRLNGEVFAANSPVDFTVEGERADSYRYHVLKDGTKLFSAESQRAFGSYLPRETGEYTLQATAIYDDGEESTQAEFAVSEPLSMRILSVTDEICTGEPLKVQMEVSGGAGEKRCFYTILSGGKILLREQGSADWHWVPEKAGAYELHAAVQDEQGACVNARVDITVEMGEGMSSEAAGGELGANGGQKCWIIYSTAPWTAHTDADFIILENCEGQSGDALTVTVDTSTGEYREAAILLQSGAHQLTLTAAQSAGHGVDEEVSLFASAQSVYVDGQTHAVWTNAQNSRFFHVEAAQEWQADTQADFIRLEKTEDGVELHADANGETSVRSALVTLTCEGSFAYIHVYQPPVIRVKEEQPAQEWPEMSAAALYSQSSGFWKDKKYGASNLQKSGCAIFALSHALQQLGFEGESITPEALAKKYAFCLREDGTINSTLVGNAGDDLGFKTRYDLYHDLRTIRSKAQEGAVFSFAVVNGHIAMVAEVSEDGAMVRVVDSAPSATWERIESSRLYIEQNGAFAPVDDLADLPGIRYYPETNAFGAATYWLESSYAARRGLRLIQPE